MNEVWARLGESSIQRPMPAQAWLIRAQLEPERVEVEALGAVLVSDVARQSLGPRSRRERVYRSRVTDKVPRGGELQIAWPDGHVSHDAPSDVLPAAA